MAGLLWKASSGDVGLTANTPKTVLQIKAPTNQRVVIRAVTISMVQPPSASTNAIKMRFTYSTANFGTGTAVTPQKVVKELTETIQSTVFANFTVEPTSPTDDQDVSYVQFGTLFPDERGSNRQIWIPGGYAENIELTSPATATVNVTVVAEE